MKKHILLLVAIGLSIISCDGPSADSIETIPFSSIKIGGELKERVNKNFNRLEEEKYRPENVFLTEEQSGNWPGDTEGRTILGLVMDAQASGREPKYLKQIIDLIPQKLNEKGYMGLVYDHKMNEQQLSGNGWMLRGLCEYYEWTKDVKVLDYIKSIATNLFVAGKGYYAVYPIDPDSRDLTIGGESGTTEVKGTDKWILSSDVGCLFIGMEGAIHAYKLLKDPELKEVIEEMLAKLKDIDILKIKAQTHATLTACRGLVRYAEITGDTSYIAWAEDIWKKYKAHGMTENHGNYNWFYRFDTWTEPCAIVDSYMLAVQLWMHTENPQYKEDAELIYYNALCHAQRANGGFGTDTCPGLAIQNDSLQSRSYEAHWCCTMRGGEGLGSSVRYSAFTKADTLYIPFLRACSIDLNRENTLFSFSETTNYPFEPDAQFKIRQNTVGKLTIKFPYMSWMENPRLIYNGHEATVIKQNGFLTLSADYKQGDVIEMRFDLQKRIEKTINKDNTSESHYKFYYGSLLLGVENSESSDSLLKDSLTPVYHLMDQKIKDMPGDKNSYRKRILFNK